ncbi:hypothetical protein VTO73DRAFT_3861 [Trametes versicolor]
MCLFASLSPTLSSLLLYCARSGSSLGLVHSLDVMIRLIMLPACECLETRLALSRCAGRGIRTYAAVLPDLVLVIIITAPRPPLGAPAQPKQIDHADSSAAVTVGCNLRDGVEVARSLAEPPRRSLALANIAEWHAERVGRSARSGAISSAWCVVGLCSHRKTRPYVSAQLKPAKTRRGRLGSARGWPQ